MEKKIHKEKGIEYMIEVDSNHNVACDFCDASYNRNRVCRVRYDCKKNECLKVIDKKYIAQVGTIINNNNNGTMCVAVEGGNCNNCVYCADEICTLQNYVCKGDNIHFILVGEGGV